MALRPFLLFFASLRPLLNLFGFLSSPPLLPLYRGPRTVEENCYGPGLSRLCTDSFVRTPFARNFSPPLSSTKLSELQNKREGRAKRAIIFRTFGLFPPLLVFDGIFSESQY